MTKKKKNKKQGNKLAHRLQSILGGGFLANKKTLENLPFVLFLAFLAIIYISNSFYAEKNIRQIEKLQRELKELRYEHIFVKSKVMSKSRQSSVAATLKDIGIKESRVPPKKISKSNKR